MEREMVKNRISKYEDTQKQKLVQLGQSHKSYNNILAYLEDEIRKSKQMSNFKYQFLCFRDDGVYQLNRAIEEIYGVSSGKAEKTMSGEGNLETIDVKLADGTRIKVPFGNIALPEAGEGAQIKINYDWGTQQLMVTGSCEFRFATLIDDIIERAKELLVTDSIFKNQAIEITDENFMPQIIDLSNIDKEFMVLSDDAKYSLIPLDARITKSEACLAKGIPLKFGALLEGAYGTGKTLLAFKKAKEAVENNWIFIYLKDPTLLAKTLRLAKVIDKNGNGVFIFVEDIDQVTRGERDIAMQDILNTLDGGDTKDMNVISLFTTNHLELIEPTFLRGKRIGSIISLGFLDRKTAREFINIAFGKDNYVVEDEGLDKVLELIEKSDIAPAFMAEIVETVKSNMILTDENIVKAAYLETSVKSYLRQVELSRKKDMSETPEKRLFNSLSYIFTKDTEEIKAGVKELIEMHE